MARKAGRKSVPALAASPWQQGRQVIWDQLLRVHAAGDTTTIRDISRTTSIDPRTVRSYVHGLVAAGVMTEERMEVRGHPARYSLNGINVGSTAPSLRVDGTPTKPQGDGRDRMWRTMKMLRVFTARDLAVAASVEGSPIAEAEAIRYAEWLGRAGYLVVAAPPSQVPHRGRRTTWRFANNTGPRAPMILRTKVVWDPNLKKPVYAPTPRGVAA